METPPWEAAVIQRMDIDQIREAIADSFTGIGYVSQEVLMDLHQPEPNGFLLFHWIEKITLHKITIGK
jgi:hypothetical protein